MERRALSSARTSRASCLIVVLASVCMTLGLQMVMVYMYTHSYRTPDSSKHGLHRLAQSIVKTEQRAGLLPTEEREQSQPPLPSPPQPHPPASPTRPHTPPTHPESPASPPASPTNSALVELPAAPPADAPKRPTAPRTPSSLQSSPTSTLKGLPGVLKNVPMVQQPGEWVCKEHKNIFDRQCRFTNMCWDGPNSQWFRMTEEPLPVMSQHIKEGWRYPEATNDNPLPMSRGPLLHFHSRLGKLPSKVTRVTGSTLLLSENYHNYFFSFARLIAVYRNAYKLDMEHDKQRVNIVTLKKNRLFPSVQELKQAFVRGADKVGISAVLEDFSEGTVCFDQLFTGINHLFPTLVSSRVFTDHRVVGDAKPAELNSEINQGTARSIFRRVLRGLELKPVPTDPNRMIILHRPHKRTLTNVKELHRAMLRLGFNASIVSFEQVSLKEQVQTVLGANYFVAMHGAGVANTFWLNPGATVVEIFPDHFEKPTYEKFSRILDLTYFSYQNYHASAGMKKPAATRDENRNQDTTVHIEALIESIPPFARRQSALNASTSGYTKEQRRAVVDPALAAAVDHWTHFSVDTDTSNMTMRHEWPVMGRKKDLPFQLHSGWTTHSRQIRKDLLCPGSLRGLMQTPPACQTSVTRGRCYQPPAMNVLAGRNRCLQAREAAAGSSVPLPDKEYEMLLDFHMGRYRYALLDHTEQGPHVEITIATQCDLRRFGERLPRLADVWAGPMVIALLVKSMEDSVAVQQILDAPGSETLTWWADVHLIYKRHHAPLEHYPVNMMRNIANQLVLTKWTFVIDSDIIPNARAGAYHELLTEMHAAGAYLHNKEAELDSRFGGCGCKRLHVFVPPCFEFSLEAYAPKDGLCASNRSKLCMSKGEAVCKLKQGQIRPMHSYFPPAYYPSRFLSWLSAESPVELPYAYRWEPYYITESGMPPFDEAFVGRGMNFAQHSYELYASGYLFHQLPKLFVLDVPHGRDRQAKVLDTANDLMREFKVKANRFYHFPQAADLAYKRQFPNKVRVMDDFHVFNHLYYSHPWKGRRCSEPGATDVKSIESMLHTLMPPMKNEARVSPPPPGEERRVSMVRDWRELILARQDSTVEPVKEQMQRMQQAAKARVTKNVKYMKDHAQTKREKSSKKQDLLNGIVSRIRSVGASASTSTPEVRSTRAQSLQSHVPSARVLSHPKIIEELVRDKISAIRQG